MPPAFVLSQDQTLMLILDFHHVAQLDHTAGVRLTGPPNARTYARAYSDSAAAARASLLPYNANQQGAPEGASDLHREAAACCHVLAEAGSPRPEGPRANG